MTQLQLLGELRELPAAAEHAPQLARFEDFLVERGEMPRAEARTLIGALVASIFEGACNRAGKAMRADLEAIVQIRATLRVRYAEVIKLFSGPRGSVAELPPGLDEPAFKGLFNDLAKHLEALKGIVEEATDALDEPEMLTDLKEAEAPVKTVRRPRVPDVLTDPRTRPVQRPPGIYEQQRVELDYYREAVRDNPDPQLRRAAEASLAAFIARFRLPSGWRVRLRRIPEYGFTLEQITELASRDPNFADRGFEVVIDVPQGAAPWATRGTGPWGASFAPDGVMQYRGGFLFLEYKTSWAPESESFYASPRGRARLRADIIRRAQMSLEIPGCAGWGYKTGVQWLDDAVSSVLKRMRERDPDPAIRDLAQRIHVLSTE